MRKRRTTAGLNLSNRPRVAAALVIGFALALIGVFGAMLPPVDRMETDTGLKWLFWLRGARPAPSNVVVISIDQESARRLHLPNELRQWPRSLHARLIRQLNARGVRAIAFDVNFARDRDPVQDERFANAIRRAGNVVLFEYLRPLPPLKGWASIIREKRVRPAEPLAQAAAGRAPFPLPSVPARVSQVWLFRDSNTPTLPMLALQQYARPYYPAFRSLVADAGRAIQSDINPAALPKSTANLVATARDLRELFQLHPELAEAVRERLTHAGATDGVALNRALLTAYCGPPAPYLDLYGPPRSITTVPYNAVLNSEPLHDDRNARVNLRGKVAFVGYSEKFHQPEHNDEFDTVFSRPDGLRISGVEIAATTFANLLEGRSVTPLPWRERLLLIAAWGLFTGAALVLLPGVVSVPIAGLLAAGGMSAAYLLFNAFGLWLPIVVPLMLQLPLALGGALFGHYLYMRRGSGRLHKTLSVYLPKSAVAQLALPAADATRIGRTMFGVCLATDIAGYSALSESLAPDALRVLLNRYFERLFGPVRRLGGEVCDINGDAMLALWIEGRQVDSRAAACRAAVDIFHAVDGFGRDLDGARLPTRIGLHCGRMEMGTVGSGDHFEYRAVGEIINTATRIEGLSKHLGTWLLASEEVVAGLSGIITRELGSFKLAGKSTPLNIHELLAVGDALNPALKRNGASFEQALAEFRTGHWRSAHEAFDDYLSDHKRDGPARYYLRLCARYQRRPPTDWDGTITLRDK